jgi:hypothetical protein
MRAGSTGPHADVNTIQPLEYLRECLRQEKEVKWEGDQVICGDYKISRSWPCGTISSKSGKVEPVDIASIVYLYETRETDYLFAECKAKGVKYFSVVERDGLLEYLTNDRAVSPVIDSGPPVKILRKRGQDGYFHTQETVEEPDGELAEDGEEDDVDPMAFLRKHERGLGGRNAAVRLNGTDFKQDIALKFVAEELASSQKAAERKKVAEESHKSKMSKVSRGPVVRPSLLEELTKKMRDGGDLRPYIILPRSSYPKNMLNLLNGEEFLKNSKFIVPQGDVFKAEPIEVEANINGKAMIFRVTDDVSRFKKNDWLMTVAVFIDGSRWQFNKWPFGTLADLFATIKGFHLSYDQTATPRYPNTLAGEMWSAAQKELVGSVVVDPFPVVKYTVKRSTISRHVDALCAYQFWKEMEDFLLKPRIAKFSNDGHL